MPRLRPPYVAQVGLFGRPTLEHNMETVYWVREIVEKGAQWFAGAWAQRPQGLALVLGLGAREEARRAPRARGHHGEGADRRILRRHAATGTSSTRYLPGGASGGILPASKGDIPLDFDTLQPHGCFIGSAAVVVLSDKDTRARRGAQPDEVLPRRVLRPVHAVPRRHRQGAGAHGSAEVGPAAARGAVAGDDGRVDLRPGAGGAEPGALRHEVFPARDLRSSDERVTRSSSRVMPIEFKLNGETVVGRRRRDHHRDGEARTASTSRTSATRTACARTATAAPAWSRSRASACWRLRAAAIRPRAWRSRPTVARALHSQKMVLELLLSDMPEHELHAATTSSIDWAKKLERRQAAIRRRGAAGGRPLASGDRGQPRRVHPVHALRARLPRGAGERRHRLRVPRRALEDRVRLRRSDGRVDLRRLRRMRAGLPDRRAHAGARRRPGRRRQDGRLGVPVLRRRLPAHLPRQGQQDRVRRGPGRPGEPRAACA